MKILYVIHAFPPYSRYGAENYAFALAQQLNRAHEVFVFHRIADQSQQEYATQERDYEGLRVCTINNTFRNVSGLAQTYRNADIAEKFGAHLDAVRPDIVHFHHLTCLCTTCIEEAHRRGIPIVYTLHDFWLFCPRGQFLTRDLQICKRPEGRRCLLCNANQLGIAPERTKEIYSWLPSPLEARGGFLRRFFMHKRAYRALRREEGAVRLVKEREDHIRRMCGYVAAFHAPSHTMQKTAERIGIPGGKIFFSRYGLNSGQLDGFERKPSDGVRFGFLGSLIPSKGSHILIRAFRRVADRKARLKIFGAPYEFEGYEDYHDRLRDIAAADSRIKLAGAMDNSRIAEVFAQIDVLVVPSIWQENMPLTIEEAVLTRTPLIVSDTGGMRERIDEVGGLKFRTGSVKDLAQKMSLLAGDGEMVRRLSPEPSRVKTVAEGADEILGLYERIK